MNIKRKTASALIQSQDYWRDNPLSAWLFTVSLLSGTLTAANHFLPMSSISRATYTCFTFIQPTIALAMRSSDKARQHHPFPTAQERIMGCIAVFAAAVSVAAVTSFLVSHFFHVSFECGISTLIGMFVFSTVFAMAMGYAARRTKAGYWSAIISMCVFLLVVAAEFLAMVTWWLR